MTEYLTRQEMFDISYRGLASQGWENSINSSGSCSYRGINGLKCAIGWLIPDDKYKSHMDRGKTSIGRKPSVMKAARISKDDLYFATQLQMIHDGYGGIKLKKSMDEFAEVHNLTIPEV